MGEVLLLAQHTKSLHGSGFQLAIFYHWAPLHCVWTSLSSFPNSNLISSHLSLSHLLVQVPVWSSAAWSTQTAGTAMRWRECAASRRTSTHWGPAPCAGPTSWPSWASWTHSSSPSWPLSWATVRTAWCLRSCWEKVNTHSQFFFTYCLICEINGMHRVWLYCLPFNRILKPLPWLHMHLVERTTAPHGQPGGVSCRCRRKEERIQMKEGADNSSRWQTGRMNQ